MTWNYIAKKELLNLSLHRAPNSLFVFAAASVHESKQKIELYLFSAVKLFHYKEKEPFTIMQ